MALKYDVKEKIFSIESKNNWPHIELNKMVWGFNEEKYDLRRWQDGNPMKGFTLEEEELENLYKKLKDIFEEPFEEVIDEELTVNFDDETEDELMDFRSFVVNSDMNECKCNGHRFKKVKTKAPVYSRVKKTVVMVDALETYYCKDCKAYYIGKHGYNLLKRVGSLMCSVFDKDKFDEFVENGREFLKAANELNEESKLKVIGYNVQKGKLSDDERKMILKYAYLSGYMTKEEITGHLNFLIKLNEGKPMMVDAVEKWNQDRKWLNNILPTDQIPVGIKRIIVMD